MKKIIAFALMLTLLSVAASAQRTPQERLRRYRMEQRFYDGRLNPPERMKMRHDILRYKMAQRRAWRDGRIGPRERRRLAMMKRHNRRELYYFRHNRPRRVI